MRSLSKTSLCSSLAIATALMIGAKPAAAQVAGSGGFTAGSGSINVNNDLVTITSQQAVIDWNATGTVTGGVNNFLPFGNSLTFSGASDFAVLNRVSTGSDMLGLNGTVNSTVDGVSGRGTVFFYNPNGIVVGGNAMIDVGSLGLTTSDPGTGSNWFSGFNAAAPTLTFSGVTNGLSQIQINAGAELRSNGTDSFIAIVAPKITSTGNIRTDGDVALVAAEAATLSFSDQYDLYSIQVDIGTGYESADPQNPVQSLTVNGGTIGRNSATETAGIARNAYLVTVAKNDATTMLISGGATLGFDVAADATVEGNSIVLSAGRDTAYTSVSDGATINLQSAQVRSALQAYATDEISIAPASAATSFWKDVSLEATNLISITAANNNIVFGGSLTADVSDYAVTGADGDPGDIYIQAAFGRSLSVADDMLLDASAHGGDPVDNGFDGTNAQGGTVTLDASGGAILAGTIYVDATGTGGFAWSDATGGTGTGGTVGIFTSSAGTISTGSLTAYATGEGGSTSECTSCNITGGTGQGGIVNIGINGGGSLTSGWTEIYAYGQGGAGDVKGGNGTGGDLTLTVTSNSTASLGFAMLFADGAGGTGLEGGAGGDGIGGTATMNLNGSGVLNPMLSVDGLYFTADGVGGDAGWNGTGDGGSGSGGTTLVTINNATVSGNDLFFGAVARGGWAGQGRSGDATGGTATVSISNSAIVTPNLTVSANATAPNSEGGSASGGNLQGGTASLSVDASTVSGASGPTAISVFANAFGDDGESGSGGNAAGGSASASFADSQITAGAVLVDAGAQGGEGLDGDGGDAAGGIASLAVGDGAALTAANVTVTSKALGGAGTASGGAASSSAANAYITGASANISGTVSVDATATGGAGVTGGNANGGDATLTLAGASLTAAQVDVLSQAVGGAGGGDAVSGNAGIGLIGGSTLTAPTVQIFADALGGYGGGEGQGGDATLVSSDGVNAINVSNTLWLSSTGVGGDSTVTAGDGRAATAAIYLEGGTTLTVGNAFLFADGVGGNGLGSGDAGAGYGGTARVSRTDVGGGTIVHNGSADFHITAEGYGGSAADGDGGYAQGGTANYYGDALTFTSTNRGLYISSFAVGGNSVGGAGGAALGGTADFNQLNNASLTTAGDLQLRSYARGGNGIVGGDATATSAIAYMQDSDLVTGTQLTETASVWIEAHATGGIGSAGNGGNAVAGIGGLQADNGSTASITGLFVNNAATGGAASGAGASGGSADGGDAWLRANNFGQVDSSGNVELRVSAIGGAGSNGADGGDVLANQFGHVVANTAGSIDIQGTLLVDSQSTGGAGANGGDVEAIIDYVTPFTTLTRPYAGIIANGGSVNVAGTTMLWAHSTGGDSIGGGNGGNAAAGLADVVARNNAGGASVITLADVELSAWAEGGDGGVGTSDQSPGGIGGNGGNGGDVNAGVASLMAESLNGQITAQNVTFDVASRGGNGGDGGFGDAAGGNGGDGGSVLGTQSSGLMQLGTFTGSSPAGLTQNLGFTHVAAVTFDGSATGGDGGWAGWATGGTNGVAGNGGNAVSGFVGINNRGGDLTADSITGWLDATGGSGGYNPNESIGGVGGDAVSAWVSITNRNRLNNPAMRGTMTVAGAIDFSAISTGGAGAVSGRSLHLAGLSFETQNSDSHVGSISFVGSGVDGVVDGFEPWVSQIAVQNGTAVVDGDVSIVTPGFASIWAENGTFTAPSLSITAADFTPHHTLPAPNPLGLVSVGALSLTSDNNIMVLADLSVGGGIDLTAGGSIILSNATSTDGNIDLFANGDISALALQSAGNILAQANGAVDVGGLSASGDIDIYGNGVTVGGASAGGWVSMLSYTGMDVGDIAADGFIDLTAATDMTAGALATQTGAIDLAAGQSMTVGSADSATDLIMEAVNGSLTLTGNSTAYGDIDLTANGLVQTADLAAEGSITVVGGGIDVGNLHAGASLGGIGGMAFGEGEDIALWSTGTVDALALTATGSVGIAAPGAISVGAINAGQLVMLLGSASIATGGITAGDELYIGGYDLFADGYVDEVFDPAPILAQAPSATGGNVAIGGAVSATQVRIAAGGNLSAGAVTSLSGDVTMSALGGVTTGAILSAGNVDVQALGGNMTVGNVDATTSLQLSASGSLAAGTLDAVNSLFVQAGGALSAGPATTDTFASFISSAGPVTLAGIDAGYADVFSGGNVTVTGEIAAGTIRIEADGNSSLQALTSTGDLGVIAGGTASFTNASAGGDAWIAGQAGISGQSLSGSQYALLMSDGAINLGSVSADPEIGRIGIGGFGMVAEGNVDGFLPSFAFDAIGSVGPSGQATIAMLDAAVIRANTTSATFGTLDADTATIDAVGLVSATGGWSTSGLFVTSGDIDIGANATIDASYIELTSTNTIGAGLGDNAGVPQGGYLLSNAEFGRITSGNVLVTARMNDAAIDLTIGDLTLAGGSGNTYSFGVVNPDGYTDGRLRVVGNVAGQGFTDADRLDLGAQLMEIDAVNGGIDFSPNSDNPIGTLAFYGQRVHIAEAAVLDKLAADIDYAGRDEDLATAPDAPHSETTVNVGLIELHMFEPGNLGELAVPAAAATYSIYAQNMGSGDVRSGLLIADAEIFGNLAPGSVEMIINGKLVTEGGTLEGEAVRDYFIADEENQVGLFTASSSINGCALDGSACLTVEPPPPPPPPPGPEVIDLANQLVWLDTSVGDQLGFGEDMGTEEEGEEESDEKNAIEPPRTVINGKPIDPQTPTDEPVSGSGNPALIGTGSNPQEQQ